MLFNSQAYLLFLPAVVILYWLLPRGGRPSFLLAVSYGFYAFWNAFFLLLIVPMTLANFTFGLLQARQRPRRRVVLATAIGMNLVILAIFKYLGFLERSLNAVISAFGLPSNLSVVELILPLGLSFFTFEFLHYQIDIFRGSEPIRDPIRFALFPAFFPTQIAGPIKRYQDFDRQVGARLRFDADLCLEGVELIALGLFKKVALADSLVPIAGSVFGSTPRATVLDGWVGLLAFALQIYLDFSGYTDIGRGSAQLLGYRVPVNFNAPYLATNFRDFWRRWHMSLSTWLRDYLYIPLGGSRVSSNRTRLNLMTTMALGGLWHGAAWHFVMWGAGHGFGLVLTPRRNSQAEHLPPSTGPTSTVFSWLFTQLAVLLLWALFRAPRTQDAVTLWTRLLRGGSGLTLLNASDVVVVLAMAIGVLGAQLVLRTVSLRERVSRTAASIILRPVYVIALATVAGYFGVTSAVSHRFIYFQF